MKKIIRTTKEFLSAIGQPIKLDNYQLIRSIIETPPPEGFTIAQIEQRVCVLQAMKKAPDGPLILEDSEHQVLLSSLANHRFGMATEELLDLVNTIRHPEEE